MESTNNNNSQSLFLCELKELKNELSAVKKRIDQLEESHEKQQEKINILETENNALKTELLNNTNGNKEVRSVLKRKRTDQAPEKEIDSNSSTSALASAGKKKTKTNNNDDEVAVLPKRDNGDSFDSLSDDLLHKIVEFDGNCYEKFGSINKRCKNIYDVKEYKLKKQTCVFGYGTVDMMLEHYLRKRREGTLDDYGKSDISKAAIIYDRLDAVDWIIQLGDSELLKWLCIITVGYGRINILSKVFLKCNLTMLDELLDGSSMCYGAALNGKLETLKWLRNHGAKWDADTFIAASARGHDEIVQYLRDESCPAPFEDTDESLGSEQVSSDEESADL